MNQSLFNVIIWTIVLVMDILFLRKNTCSKTFKNILLIVYGLLIPIGVIRILANDLLYIILIAEVLSCASILLTVKESDTPLTKLRALGFRWLGLIWLVLSVPVWVVCLIFDVFHSIYYFGLFIRNKIKNYETAFIKKEMQGKYMWRFFVTFHAGWWMLIKGEM